MARLCVDPSVDLRQDVDSFILAETRRKGHSLFSGLILGSFCTLVSSHQNCSSVCFKSQNIYPLALSRPFGYCPRLILSNALIRLRRGALKQSSQYRRVPQRNRRCLCIALSSFITHDALYKKRACPSFLGVVASAS